MLWSYSLCAAIICVEALRRYLFQSQAPWTPMAAIYLFIWLTWIACAYNVKTRTHLRFDALRKNLPYQLQFALQLVDHAIWVLLGIIITGYGFEQMTIQRRIGAVVQGTDNFPLWIAFMGVPLGWVLVLWRVIENIGADIRRFHRGEPLLDTQNLGEAG
jgi:TRAP-type C4-dicarboxylate transport system permease small subunit